MPLVQEKAQSEHYTYTDYLEWDEDFRAEIVDGEMYVMSPPATYHQGISGALYLKIGNFLEDKPYKVYAAPFGVRLFPEQNHSDDTIVEPDISVICDTSKLDKRGCNGAPDMVIEILSPSSSHRDRMLKFNLYLKAGVREYWVVDPDAKLVQVHLLDEGRYVTKVYGVYNPLTDTENERKYMPDIAPVSVLPGCFIDLNTIFKE